MLQIFAFCLIAPQGERAPSPLLAQRASPPPAIWLKEHPGAILNSATTNNFFIKIVISNKNVQINLTQFDLLLQYLSKVIRYIGIRALQWYRVHGRVTFISKRKWTHFLLWIRGCSSAFPFSLQFGRTLKTLLIVRWWFADLSNVCSCLNERWDQPHGVWFAFSSSSSSFQAGGNHCLSFYLPFNRVATIVHNFYLPFNRVATIIYLLWQIRSTKQNTRQNIDLPPDEINF